MRCRDLLTELDFQRLENYITVTPLQFPLGTVTSGTGVGWGVSLRYRTQWGPSPPPSPPPATGQPSVRRTEHALGGHALSAQHLGRSWGCGGQRGVASAPIRGTRALTHAGSVLRQGGGSGPAQSRSGADTINVKDGAPAPPPPPPPPRAGSCSLRFVPSATSPRAAAGAPFPGCGLAGPPASRGLRGPRAWGSAGGLRTRKPRGA